MSAVPDFCREGCYWEDCGHRAPLTVEDRLHRAFEPSPATRQALAEAMAPVRVGGYTYPRFDPAKHVLTDVDHHRDEIDQYIYFNRERIMLALPKPGDEPDSTHVWKDQR